MNLLELMVVVNNFFFISDIEKEMTVKIERLLIDISQQKVNLEVALRNNLNFPGKHS